LTRTRTLEDLADPDAWIILVLGVQKKATTFLLWLSS